MATNLKEIVTMDVPEWQMLEKMPLQELKEWERKLSPFYVKRSQILDEYGISAYKKAMRCSHVFRCIEKLERKSEH